MALNNDSISLNSFQQWMIADKHPQVDSWPLMSSPVPIFTICGIYLLFVLKIGPKFMEHRKPYDLRNIIIAYNFLQVLFSIGLCFYFTGFRFDYYIYFITDGCHPKKTLNTVLNVNIGGWWYLIAKLFEFLDTICFILRKKSNQVTKLHVYHHSSTALYAWAYLKYIPGDQGVIVGFQNSFVHIFMYSYYFLSALGPQYQKYLWWKKYITVIQLIQFTLDVIYLMALLILDCDPPKLLTFLFGFNTLLFIVLFMNFYINAYKNKNKKQN